MNDIYAASIDSSLHLIAEQLGGLEDISKEIDNLSQLLDDINNNLNYLNDSIDDIKKELMHE